MSGVFLNIPPPTLRRGEDTLAGWRGGGGSIVRKTPDTALSSIYVSTLGTGLFVQNVHCTLVVLHTNCVRNEIIGVNCQKSWVHSLVGDNSLRHEGTCMQIRCTVSDTFSSVFLKIV
jgi:hypothetical protein